MEKNNNELMSREDRIQKAIALYKSQPHPKSQKKAAEAFQVPRSTLSMRLRAISKEQEEEVHWPRTSHSTPSESPSDTSSDAPSDGSMSTQSYLEVCRQLVGAMGTEVLPATAIDVFERIICEHSANIESTMESTMDRLQELKDHVQKANKREKGSGGPDYSVADYLAGEAYKVRRARDENSQMSDSEEDVALENTSEVSESSQQQETSSQLSQHYPSSSQDKPMLCKNFLDTVEGGELPQMDMLMEVKDIVSQEQKALASAMDGVEYMIKSTEKATKRERDRTLPGFVRGEGCIYGVKELDYMRLVAEIETHLTPQMRKCRKLHKEEERLDYFAEKEERRAVAAWEYGQEVERQEQKELKQQEAKQAKKPSKKRKKTAK